MNQNLNLQLQTSDPYSLAVAQLLRCCEAAALLCAVTMCDDDVSLKGMDDMDWSAGSYI